MRFFSTFHVLPQMKPTSRKGRQQRQKHGKPRVKGKTNILSFIRHVFEDSSQALHAKYIFPPCFSPIPTAYDQPQQTFLLFSKAFPSNKHHPHADQIIPCEEESSESIMEYLVKQMSSVRERFSGAGRENKEEPSSIKERRIPLQKTQSFKGEKSQNWFQRRSLRQTRRDNGSGDEDDYIIEVTAAAFAIYSLEESGTKDEQKNSEGLKTSLTKSKSKKEDTTVGMQEPGRVSERFPGEASRKSSEGPDKMLPTSAPTEGKMPEKAVGPAPSTKKAPSFSDKSLDSTGDTKPERQAPQPDLPSTVQPAFRPTGTKSQSSIGETPADTWEKAEMAKIKERYEKSKSSILSWEDKKKKQAKRQMDRTESELQKRRAKAMKRYNSDMEYIIRTAGGARTQAENKQRNEEFKVKEKANKIRSTGKVPSTCFCC